MKKITVLIVTLLALSLFWGCGKAQPEQPENDPKPQTDAQTPPEEEIPPEETEDGQKYPDVKECAVGTGFLTAKSLESDTPCEVRIIKVRDYEDTTLDVCYDLHIEVNTGTNLLDVELESCVTPLSLDRVYFGDVDGDGLEEILLHDNTGGVGGAGLWRSWVLKLEGDELRVLFKNFDEFDTGFACRFLEGYQLEITNRITDYTLVFAVNEWHREYIDDLGELPTSELWLDPFYQFIPEDVDHDGISEIVCGQYTSIMGHADYTGSACSVLKFNTSTQAFEVVDAWYEPYIEE